MRVLDRRKVSRPACENWAQHPVPPRKSQFHSPGTEAEEQELTGRCSSSMKAGAAAVKDASASKPPSAVAEAVNKLAWVESDCKIKCSN